jgi:hypothetical protein
MLDDKDEFVGAITLEQVRANIADWKLEPDSNIIKKSAIKCLELLEKRLTNGLREANNA